MDKTKMAEAVEQIKPWLQSGSIDIFGKPFAGKDTQGKHLAELLNGVVIGGGDIIRKRPELAHLKEIVKDGTLAPKDEFLKAVVPVFSSDEYKGHPLILSTVGRWHGEEEGVMAGAKQSGHPLKAVVYIHITEDELHKRWSNPQKDLHRGYRDDDAEHYLQNRLHQFKTKTLPVIEFFRKKDLLIEVNGERDQDEVLLEILEKLAARAQKGE